MISGISSLSGEQIIAAGSLSSCSAATASYTTGGDDLQGLYTTVNSNSGNWNTPLFPDNITANSLYIENNGDITLLQLTGDDSDDYAQTVIRGSGIEFINGQIDPTVVGTIAGNDVSNWNSTYNTVSANSGSWTGGSTYTGDAQGALDEVYTNSGTWNMVTDKLDTTAQVVTATGSASVMVGWFPQYLVSSINGSAILPYGFASLSSNSANWNSTYNTVSTNSGSWTGGGGGGVSGTNVVFVPYYEGAEDGEYWSASISGDIKVATGFYDIGGQNEGVVYSLSSIGNSLGSKLDKSTIDGSNTLINYAGHAEVGEKAYRVTGFINGSADDVHVYDHDASIRFDSEQIEPGTHLYSAIVIVETTTTGDVPEKWNLISYENNSAILTRNFSVNTNYEILDLLEPYGWYITNCDASATVYSALEIAPLAFKDEIAFTDVSDIVVTASLPVSPVSSTLYLIPEA